MSIISSSRGAPTGKDIAINDGLSYVGTANRADLKDNLDGIDSDLTKFGEDRNSLLAEGGTITFTGTTVTFSAALKLHINSKVAGGSPTVIDLGSTTRTVDTDGDMIYATIDRSLGTATVTDDSLTLPSVVAANKEIFLIAKRVGTRLYFRNGTSIGSGESGILGAPGANTALSNLSSTSINQNLVPDSNNTRSLGASPNLWANSNIISRSIFNSTGATLQGVIAGQTPNTLPSGDSENALYLRNSTASHHSVHVYTQNHTALNATPSANVKIETGNKTAGTGNSGDIKIQTGTSSGGTRGRIELDSRTIGLDARLTVDPSGSFNASEVYYNTTINKFKYFDGTVWKELGSGTGTGTNYVEGGDAEAGTTGWTLYDDGDVATPVDGTGDVGGVGDNTVSFTTTSTAPLRGLNSFLFSKSAASGRGEGVAFDFTIDDADKAKVLSISFDYEVASGTYADGDLTVYIIGNPGVTNEVIQPAGFTILNTGVESKHVATFQTSVSYTSYRLVFHVASTNASAYSVKIDSVIVGPQVVQFGAPVTDWVSFVPTGTWTTNTTYTGRWRRVGDSMEIQALASLSGGGPNTAALVLNLPSFVAIDTSRLASASNSVQVLGSVNIRDAGTRLYTGSVVFNSSTSVIASHSESSGFGGVDQASPISFGSGDSVSFDFTVPIVGWSSSVQMSSDTDTRVVAATAHRNGTAQTGLNPNNSAVQLVMNSVAASGAFGSDTHGAFDTSNGSYVVKVPGWLEVDATVLINATNVTNTLHGLFLYRGATFGSATLIAAGPRHTPAAVTAMGLHIKAKIKVSAEDRLWLALSSQGNNSVNTLTMEGSAVNSYWSISRISGPSAIAASERIYVHAAGNSGQSVGSSLVDIVFNTTIESSHGAGVYNSSTGIFTAPRNDVYTFSTLVSSVANLGTGERFVIRIVTTGLSRSIGRSNGTGALNVHAPTGSISLRLNAGETAKIQGSMNSSNNLSVDALDCWFTIRSGGM